MKNTNKILNTNFVLQQGESDCGVACLLSIIRHHGGNNSLENLRELSGTSIQGTSMLGLQQAASQLGFEAEAFEVDDLNVFKQEATFPCILHVVIDDNLEHYVIALEPLTENLNANFSIFNPAIGFEEWSNEKLLSVWQSRAVLLLNPTEAFVKTAQNNKAKIVWFKNLIKDDAPLLIIAGVLGIVLAVLGMSTAIFSQKLLDEILPKHQTQRLWLGVALLAILLVARAGLGYMRGFFLIRQSRDFNVRLMDDFYEKLLRLPKTFFDSRKTGEIIARLSDTRRIQQVINFLVGNVVIDLLVLLISAGFVFSYSVTIGLISLLSVPLFGFLIWKFNARIIQNQKEVMAQYASTESHFVDAITGISVIKATNNEGLFGQIGRGFYQLFQQKIYNLGTLGNRYGLWNELLNAILITLVLSVSSYIVLQKHLLIGEMMAIISIAGGMISAIGRLATTNIQLQEAKIAFERMYEFASLLPENNTNHTWNNSKFRINSLTINNLCFRFAGRSQLLHKISLKINKGQLLVLLGEVGSGKSILLQILQKFQPFEEGKILVNDTLDFKEIPVKIWRETVGVVPQEVKIFNSTLIENIILGDVTKEGEKAFEFCKQYGFDKYFEAFPQGYLTIVGEEGINLSGGQKQLVALARALFRKPSLLLLDEATSAMDNKTESFVLDLLDELKSKMSIVMITHRNNIAEKADKVYVLEKGILTNQTLSCLSV